MSGRFLKLDAGRLDAADMDILGALRAAERPLDDEQLAAVLGVDARQVVQRCRRLAFQGIVIRENGPGGTILNRLDETLRNAPDKFTFSTTL